MFYLLEGVHTFTLWARKLGFRYSQNNKGWKQGQGSLDCKQISATLMLSSELGRVVVNVWLVMEQQNLDVSKS